MNIKSYIIKVGDKVNLVDDQVRGVVAAFNGNGYLEVPFLRDYFSGKTIYKFTIMAFFKKTTNC